MDSIQQKEQLRKQLLEKRESLPLEKWTKASEIIIESLKQLSDYKNAKIIHCYVSINERREVNTHPLIREMIERGKKVVVPVTHFEEGTLSHIALKSFDDLKPNHWGILEPVNGREVTISDIELVIVPMAGGDENCHRIGYGGGFYDRFLKDVSCLKIGLAFEQNIKKKLPVEPFDVALDRIVTEERILGDKL